VYSHKNRISLQRWLSILAVAALLVATANAQATEKVLFNLGGSGANGGLIFDENGNLYGTLSGQGKHFGSVFQLHRFAGGTWGYKTLFSFSGGADGGRPQSDLILDGAGNLIGTTWMGGAHARGAVFLLTPTPTGKWSEKVLYDFAGGSDGDTPSGGVISDAAGNLYGTTWTGGPNFWGTVFELMPNPDGTYTNKVLYSFTGGADGRLPSGGVVRDSVGNLYGTTFAGGISERGSVFQLSPNPDGSWTFRSLYLFCASAGCRDGARPNPVALDSHGNLYGSTGEGGIVPCNSQDVGCGTLYRLSHGSGGKWTFQLLHKFCSVDECADGTRPNGALIFDNAGAIFGTAMNSIFKVTHTPGSPWSVGSFFTFCQFSPCPDGAFPIGRLLLDANHNIYGTAQGGGSSRTQAGVVFEITP